MFGRIFLAYLFCFFMLAKPAFSYGDEDLTVKIYQDLKPAIVVINADVDDAISSGTGCIVDENGLILTSRHVIEDAKNIEVVLNNDKTFKAKIVSIMGENGDLALLKINPKEPLPAVRMGDSKNVKVGQKVLAIGNPFGFNGTLTTGIISRIDYKKNKIQTDAAINPGSSGGPLINTKGEVIGINQSIYNPDNNKSNIGIGFAVPINTAKSFITKVKSPSKS